MKVCQHFQIDYLWIDSLCIIQDSKEDWERESALMAGVHGNGMLKIAAISSLDANTGCFFNRPNNWISRILVELNGQQVAYSCLKYDWNRPTNALKSRGWIVRERVLSKRTIHFTDSQDFWECDERPASEAYIEDFSSQISVPSEYEFAQQRQTLDRSSWDKIIQRHVQTELTLSKDRLVAIAGVAQTIQLKTGEEYVAGCWHGDIENIHCVCWRQWHLPESGLRLPRTLYGPGHL